MPNKILNTLEIAGEPFDVPQGTGTVTGVKGQQETAYREGNVNLTPENLLYLGTNPNTLAQDTKEWWASKGTGYAWINAANLTNGQPTTYGFLVNYVRGNIVAQEWHAIGSGQMYYRGASGTVTTMPNWSPVNTNTTYTAGTNLALSGTSFSVKDSPAFTGTPTAPTNTTYTTSNTQIATTAFVQGAILRRLPKSLEKSGTVSNFNLASGTATLKDCFTASAAGIIFVTAFAQFAANATGSRSFSIYIDGNGTGSGCILPGAAGIAIGIGAAAMDHVASGDKIQLRFLQSSGSTLAISNINYRAYLIKD